MSTYRRSVIVAKTGGEFVSDEIERCQYLRFLNVDATLGDQPVYMHINQSIGQAGITGTNLQLTPGLWLAQIPISTRYTYDLGKAYMQSRVYLFRGDGGPIAGKLDTDIEPFGDVIDRLPAGTTDIIDRASRLLGHVTVDSVSGLPQQSNNQSVYFKATDLAFTPAVMFIANLNRKKIIVYNDGLTIGPTGYIHLMDSGNNSRFAAIGPGQTYESSLPVYTGGVDYEVSVANIHVFGIEEF